MNVLIASHNQGKIREFKNLFEPLGLTVQSLVDYPEIEEVEETGTTFEENARLKAETIARSMGVIALADDSGLVVPALNGAPGVYSARYSGEPKDDQRNNYKLLAEMEGLEGEDRTAYFVSCLVLAYPGHESLVVEGHANGYIETQLNGVDGFGYDPLFYYPPLEKTFGELTMEQKNQVSHRAVATQILLEKINQWIEGLNNNENDGAE